MKFNDINEPIILSSKSGEVEFYTSLILPLFLTGFGFFDYLREGKFLFLIAGLAAFIGIWIFKSIDETYITREAIYNRDGNGNFENYRFSDLSYAWFDDDVVYFIFGKKGDRVYSILSDAKHYEDIRAYLEQVSQKHLPYHRYEFATRSQLSPTDRLGCLECQSIFGYSKVTHWKTEKSWWSFLIKLKPEIAVCPSCKKDGRVIVSRTGRVTADGLKSLNELSKQAAI